MSDRPPRGQFLSGVGVINATPFARSNGVDEDEYRRHVRWMFAHGVRYVVPGAGTGQGLQLTPPEEDLLIRVAAEEARGEQFVASYSGRAGTAETVEALARAKDHGATCAFVIQPYWTLPDREGLLHHYKTIATVGLPIVLYNNQKRSGTPLPVALMAEIIEMSDAFVGIKQTSTDDLADTFATLGGLVTVMAKAETELPLGIALGGSSCITFAANVVPDVVVAVYRDLLRGPRDQALSLYYKWYPLFQQLIAAPVPSAIVYALNQIGFEFGSPRPPILSLAGAGAETLKSLLKELQVTPVRPEDAPRDVALSRLGGS